MSWGHPALSAFASLPLRERLFVRARLASAPLEEVALRARGQRILDVGCGHGVLCALLRYEVSGRQIMGIDPDPRKIAWASQSVGRDGVELHTATVESLVPQWAGQFDVITVADVLYLLTEGQQRDFLAACRALLRSGGQLLLKEAEDDGGWRTAKALWQERIMVRLLRRTHTSGGLGFLPRSTMVERIEAAGFRVERIDSLQRFSTTPHVLYEAEAR